VLATPIIGPSVSEFGEKGATEVPLGEVTFAWFNRFTDGLRFTVGGHRYRDLSRDVRRRFLARNASYS
jgi:hypothetical protein